MNIKQQKISVKSEKKNEKLEKINENLEKMNEQVKEIEMNKDIENKGKYKIVGQSQLQNEQECNTIEIKGEMRNIVDGQSNISREQRDADTLTYQGKTLKRVFFKNENKEEIEDTFMKQINGVEDIDFLENSKQQEGELTMEDINRLQAQLRKQIKESKEKKQNQDNLHKLQEQLEEMQQIKNGFRQEDWGIQNIFGQYRYEEMEQDRQDMTGQDTQKIGLDIQKIKRQNRQEEFKQNRKQIIRQKSKEMIRQNLQDRRVQKQRMTTQRDRKIIRQMIQTKANGGKVCTTAISSEDATYAIKLLKIKFPHCRIEDLVKAISDNLEHKVHQEIQRIGAMSFNDRKERKDCMVAALFSLKGSNFGDICHILEHEYMLKIELNQLKAILKKICRHTFRFLEQQFERLTNQKKTALNEVHVKSIILRLMTCDKSIEVPLYNTITKLIRRCYRLDQPTFTTDEIYKLYIQLLNPIYQNPYRSEQNIIVNEEIDIDIDDSSNIQWDRSMQYNLVELILKSYNQNKIKDILIKKFPNKYFNIDIIRHQIAIILKDTINRIEKQYFLIEKDYPFNHKPQMIEIVRKPQLLQIKQDLLQHFLKNDYSALKISFIVAKMKQFFKLDKLDVTPKFARPALLQPTIKPNHQLSMKMKHSFNEINQFKSNPLWTEKQVKRGREKKIVQNKPKYDMDKIGMIAGRMSSIIKGL